jgi:protein gp37
MSTQIQWTDETWNPVTGCAKVSPGCAHCYAETVALRFWPSQYPPVVFAGSEKGGPLYRPRQFTDVMTHADRLDQPLRWRKPRRVFVNSMSDLFHEAVPFEFIKRVWDVTAAAPRHTFQILTKRPERMLAFARWMAGGDDISIAEWPRNVWLGVSVENQHFADERIPLLLQTPAAVRFLSCEPLLEGLDLAKHRPGANQLWVIVGGESGAGARPCNVRWVRSIVRQCQQAGVPVFVKQLGGEIRDRNDSGFDGSGLNDIDGRCSWPEIDPDDIEEDLDGFRDGYQGAEVRVHLRDRKGGDPSEWPADLRVRQFPGVADV